MATMLEKRREPHLVINIRRETLGEQDDLVTGCAKGLRNCTAPQALVDKEGKTFRPPRPRATIRSGSLRRLLPRCGHIRL